MTAQATLHIEQGFQYEGEDWWKWSVWLEGPASELDRVKAVTYVLHPTFPNPVRTITTRNNNFRLDTSGWGTFVIYAKVSTKDGENFTLNHELRLEYPDGTATTA